MLDPQGKAIGTDFLSFYAASDLALHAGPAEAYSVAAHAAAQRRIAGAAVDYAAFFYPPVFLLLVLPLATLPYLPALAVWLAATGTGYWCALRPLLPHGWGRLASLAFPAVFLTLGHGQNAFLTTALFAVAACMLDRRPAVAGICIGLLGFKPHLALLAPVVLAAAGRWQAFVAAAASLSALLLASLLLFGAETWRAFLAGVPLARAALEMDLIGPAKMVSPFAAARLLGAPVPGAYAVQGVAAVGVAVSAAMLARRRVEGTALVAAIAAGGALTSPFLLDYDLLILAVPLAYVASAALRAGGFLPWEKTILGAAFLLPLVSRSLASAAGIPVAPLVTVALFVVVLRRALSEDVAPR
nr:glycosyltransferase family 87 protein [Pararoseomonas indoligenes]